MESIIEYNPELKAECEVQTKIIYLENGSIIGHIVGLLGSQRVESWLGVL